MDKQTQNYTLMTVHLTDVISEIQLDKICLMSLKQKINRPSTTSPIFNFNFLCVSWPDMPASTEPILTWLQSYIDAIVGPRKSITISPPLRRVSSDSIAPRIKFCLFQVKGAKIFVPQR